MNQVSKVRVAFAVAGVATLFGASEPALSGLVLETTPLGAYQDCIASLGSNDNFLMLDGAANPPVGVAQIGGVENGTPPTPGSFTIAPNGKAYFHPCSGPRAPGGEYYNLTYPGDSATGALGTEARLGPLARNLACRIPATSAGGAPASSVMTATTAYDDIRNHGVDLDPRLDLRGFNELYCEGRSSCSAQGACQYTVTFHGMRCDARACLPVNGINPCTNGIDGRTNPPTAIAKGLPRCEGHQVGDTQGEAAFAPLVRNLVTRTFAANPQFSDASVRAKMRRMYPGREVFTQADMDAARSGLRQDAQTRAADFSRRLVRCEKSLSIAVGNGMAELRAALASSKASLCAAYPDMAPSCHVGGGPSALPETGSAGSASLKSNTK